MGRRSGGPGRFIGPRYPRQRGEHVEASTLSGGQREGAVPLGAGRRLDVRHSRRTIPPGPNESGNRLKRFSGKVGILSRRKELPRAPRTFRTLISRALISNRTCLFSDRRTSRTASELMSFGRSLRELLKSLASPIASRARSAVHSCVSVEWECNEFP